MNIRSSERKDETPPYSRLFVVCSRQLKLDDLREKFEPFGRIEDLYMPKDRNTGETKGVAYIKYDKTSSAAAAIQNLHLKVVSSDNKPLKVMVAVNKNENPSQTDNEDKYKRLFIKVSKDCSEAEVRQYFSTFGHVESVHFQKNKQTDTCKGFAYIVYKSFYDAAKAFEECEKKYKPVFATPRDDLKRSRYSIDMWQDSNVHLNNYSGYKFVQNMKDKSSMPKPIMEYNTLDNHSSSGPVSSQEFNTISVVCTPQVLQKYIKSLFDIVPGMVQYHCAMDSFNGISKATVTYETPNSAAYALEKLNNFEFPSGEIITIKPDNNPLSKAASDLTTVVNNLKNSVDSGTPDLQQLAEVVARASSLIKAAALTTTGQTEMHALKSSEDPNYCSVSLPSPKPMADMNSKVAQRLFIICKPHPPSMNILIDIFCRFGDLIHVSTIPSKTFGFAKYASTKSAQDAITTLHGAIVSGIHLKVMEADEKPGANDGTVTERIDLRENIDYMDTKRMKLDN